MSGLMAVLGIMLFIFIGAVILTGAGMLLSSWQFPAEKLPQQQETDNSGTNDNSV